ncbi:unnamed protein product [Effrenium voratum]|uniref:beta-N-acetylhexosaminidase n=1 Tax=Effrenium voratum TaxID=2562239 RepID=A0AA36J0K1_9DINO|nr:unnamed protein product [Effrenium voratum]
MRARGAADAAAAPGAAPALHAAKGRGPGVFAVLGSLAACGLGLWALLALRLHSYAAPAAVSKTVLERKPALKRRDPGERDKDTHRPSPEKNTAAKAQPTGKAQPKTNTTRRNSSRGLILRGKPKDRRFALVPRPQILEGLQQTTSRSFSNWSLRAFRPSSGEERWALEALESVLQVSAQFDAPGAVTALLRAERAEARRACAEQLGLPLPSYRVHEDEQKDCQAKDWHFALSGPKGLCCAAVRPAGLFRFAQTLRQLAGEHSPANLPDFVLEDWPRFCWRGLQLDAVRHFMPVDFLKRYITALAHFKANFFHWHLTDDQSWRLFVRSRPALVNASRLTSPEFYSEQDVQELAASSLWRTARALATFG